MRILTIGNMYPPHHLGGYELMWQSWVRAARAAGHEVRVLTTDYRTTAPDPALPEDPDIERALRWYWDQHRFPALGCRATVRLERHNQHVLERQVTDFAPEVVSYWAMGAMSLALMESTHRRSLPGVAVVIDDWPVYAPVVDQWRARWARRPRLGSLVGRAARIPVGLEFASSLRWVFVSDLVRRNAVAAGWEIAHQVIAHGGVDASLFQERPRPPWRGQLLYVGRIDERKGVETAIRAAHLLPDTGLRLVGGGDAACLQRMQTLVAELGLDDRVSFETFRRPELPDVYSDADVVLFPVRWDEPWGLVPLEGMAVGVPVVATGTGGSGEYLSHEGNCLLFSPSDDERALADAIVRLERDSGLRAKLRAGGMETARRFTERRFNDVVLRAHDGALR